MITIRGINGDILTHFDNNVPEGNPYFEPVMTDDMESLVSSFSFSVPLELADTEHLVGLNQVLVKDRQEDLRLFVITDVHEVWTTVGGTLQVTCEDISINEMNNIIVSPFESLNFQDTLTKTFKNSGWALKYGANWKDVDNTTFKVENYDNMRSVIASIVDTYGCQFKFMAQENQFGEITRVAEVYKSRGNNTGKYFYYDRDLLGIERDINHADIKTAIHPYYTGYNGKTYSLKGFAPVNPDPDFKKDKDSPLIINREASKLFDDGNSYRIMPYKTEVEGDPELVYREAIKELKKHAEPVYTYSVNVLLLQNMIGWEGEDIDLGDTVWMKERVGNRELGLEARVTAYEYHEDDPSKDVVTFSNFKEIDTTDVPELAERIFIAYANSEDGIIDFSITDSVGKAYMGVYTAAVSTQSADPSTYSWTRIKGEDGISAPTLNLTSSQQVMKFKSNGTPDGNQTIIFTALKQNSTETVTWEAIPYKGDTAQPAITLGGTGDVRSLTSADWNNEWTRVKVTVSMGSLKDIQTVVMVSDGATGASGKAIVGYVTNESTTFAASSDGTVTDYSNGDGKFVLYEGTNEVTSGVAFARVSQVGINLLINDTTGEYKVSNMTTDMAQASVSATYKGITITKFLSFSKSKQGAKGDKGDTGNDGIAGKDGIGLKSTTVTYAASASGTTAPSTGWQEQVPTVAPDNFLWTRTVWTYTDDTSETGYSVAKMGRDGAKGNDGIAGKDGVGIADTLIEYAVSTSGTTKPTSGWSATIPTTPQGQYLWTRTTWTYTDETTEQGFTVARMGQDGAKGNDGIAGKDGVGLKSTAITYAGSANGTTPPTTGWNTQVPTVPAGQYLWTKTVWTYSDDSNETGYSVARMGQNGNDGKDGIAGKDGVGIKDTIIEYAVSTSGMTKPTSGWSTSIPTVPQGQYLWTRTTWAYTDNTTEQGFTVARQGEKGDKGDQGIAGPKGADGKTQYTHIAYADDANGGRFSQDPANKNYIGMYVDFEELDSSDPKKYAWSLIKGADGEQGVAGPKGGDGRTPYFHTAYINSTDFGGYDYSGRPNLAPNVGFNDFYNNGSQTGYTAKDEVDHIAVTRTADAPPAGKLLNLHTLLPNKTYTISVDIWADMEVPSGAISCSIRLREGTEVRTVWALINKPVGTNRTTYSVTFTTAANFVTTEESRISLWFNDSAGACTGYLGYNIKIEEGSTATPYQPNLLDAPWYFSTVPLGENIADPTKTFPIKSSGSVLYQGNMTEPFVVGETYTITIKGTKPATQLFRVFNPGIAGYGNLSPVEGLTDVWSLTFTADKVASDPKILQIIQTPNASVGACQIDWLKIEKGDTRTPNIDSYKYLGNYTDFEQSDSLNPTKYSWSLIKGADGETSHVHTAYAWSADGTDKFTKVYPNENLFVNSRAERTGSREFVNSPYWDMAPIIDKYGVDREYSVSFDLKSKVAGGINVYSQNGSGTRYDIGSKTIQATTEYKRYSHTFKPKASNMEMNQAMLAFYGTYDTGRIPFVKNVKFELGNEVTIDTPSPKEDYKNAYPTYTGTYSDFNVEGSDNPKDYTWARSMGNEGQDGAPAKALTLQADSPVMKFDANDVVVAGQVITFTAVKQNFESSVAWVATPYKGNTAQPAIALKGTGDVRTLEASMWASGVTTVRVDVSADTFRDSVTITKVKDGAKGDKGSDGIAGKDGVGIRTTAITYAGSASGTTPPTTGWQTQVPTVPAGQFLWTKTVWTYTDNSTETGYSAAMMGKDGAKGNDGIAGKDGVGIKTTLIEYAANASGTVRPTSGWSTTIPNTPAGQYLWTRTTWTYTDNTTEQGYTVARQGANGTNGTNGTNGIDAYSAILSNEANTFAANPAGAVTDWSTGNGTFMVYKGTTRLTSGVAYTVASSVDATGTINATTGDYTVTALAKDNGSLTFKATIGSTVLTKTMTLSKARQGVQGVQGTMGIAFYSPTEPTGDNVKEGSTWFKTVSTADNTIAGIYTYKGGKWIKTEVASGALSVEKLSALSANLGDVTAGNITGVNITGASFINPFDFTDVSMNHLKGTTEIADSEIGIEGVVNEGTTGARKFVNSITPSYFQSVHKDANGSILRSVNTSSSGIILNDSNVTTSFDKDGLRVVDMPRNASSWSMSTRIGLSRGSDGSTMEILPSGPVLNNRKNIQIWTGTGDQVGEIGDRGAANNARLRFGKYYNVGWGMVPEDIPFKQVYPYLWQVTRDIRFAVLIQVKIQDSTAPWVYYDLHYGPTTSTDTEPRGTIPVAQMGPTVDSGTVRISLKNSVECMGYVGLKANEYFSLNVKCSNDKRAGAQQIMSAWFTEIWEEGAF
ncbi:tail fiber protein [Enterococcus phage 9181]|nr:tail fiber protein [Enterococcus phage 9181]